jgi:hypothetical protein
MTNKDFLVGSRYSGDGSDSHTAIVLTKQRYLIRIKELFLHTIGINNAKLTIKQQKKHWQE